MRMCKDCRDGREKILLNMDSTVLTTDREELRQHVSNIVMCYCKEERGIAVEKKVIPCTILRIQYWTVKSIEREMASYMLTSHKHV